VPQQNLPRGRARPAVLTGLRLCRRPGLDELERTAEQDCVEIVGRFGVDAVVPCLVGEAECCA
jgi:hypothetical protein